ncbi:MAG: hypothetical protein IPO21_15665 [Bacteroidales bacterium]|nr:hypothetical protein [Bacteroidales bacterium]
MNIIAQLKNALFVVIGVIVFSNLSGCSKYDYLETDTFASTIPITELTFDNEKKAVYNDSNMRFVEGFFTKDSTILGYKLEFQKDVKYRILVTGINVELFSAKLYNQDSLYKTTAQTVDVGKTRVAIFVDNRKTNNYYLILEYQIPVNQLRQKYSVIIEELYTKKIVWQDREWICNGDWEINDSNQLVYKGFESLTNKWLRTYIKPEALHSMETEFSVTDSMQNSSIGFAFYAGRETLPILELPKKCLLMKMNAKNSEMWEIDLFKKKSITINPFTQGIKSHSNVSVNLASNLEFVVDQTKVFDSAYSTTKDSAFFYIMVEDAGFDTITFRNFSLY